MEEDCIKIMGYTDSDVNLIWNEISEEELRKLNDAGKLPPDQIWATPDITSNEDGHDTLLDLLDRTTSMETALTKLQATVNNCVSTATLQSTLASYVTSTQLQSSLTNYVTTSELQNLTTDNLKRIQIQTYGTDGEVGRYYPIASFKYPYTEAGENGASITIIGRLGGYTSDITSWITAIIQNRSGETMQFTHVGRSLANTLSRCTLVVYRNNEGIATVYLKTVSTYNKVDLNVYTFPKGQVNILFDGTYTYTPAGTLQAELTNTMELNSNVKINGTLYIS